MTTNQEDYANLSFVTCKPLTTNLRISGVESVWAIIYPPSYTQPDSRSELIPEPDPVMLTVQGDEQYSVTFDNFDESGSYRVVLYAQDDDDLTSRPKEVILDTSSNNQLYLPMIIR